MKYYTGVGSREVPSDIYEVMYSFAAKIAQKGWILRSGGASGSDTAFETGCDSVGGKKEIYLPWKGFNNNNSDLHSSAYAHEAIQIAMKIHPAWNGLTPTAKKLHSRNCFQVLGEDLQTPSKFVVCWTKDGKDVGGTRTAIVLARQHKIPVYNLAIDRCLEKIRGYL